MKIVYDDQIFMLQKFGGVSRYFLELYKKINSDKNSIVFPFVFSQNYYLQSVINKKIVSNNLIKNKQIVRLMKAINCVHLYIYLLFNRDAVYHPTWNNVRINKKTKMVITVHDMIQEILWKDNPSYAKEIENKRKAIYESDLIIAISENTKKDILKIYPNINHKKIRVIYHGTNHLPAETKPNIKLPDKYLLFVGRRAEYKGFSFMIDAIKSLMQEENLNLICVGDSFSEQEYDFLKKNGIAKNVVSIQASDSELAYLYSHAICFLFPSRYEGFGFPLLEAFDNNCPVLCSNSSCLPEIGGDAALYFDTYSEKSLIDQLKIVLHNPDIRAQMIERGRNRINKFSWDATAKLTLEVYRELMENDGELYK